MRAVGAVVAGLLVGPGLSATALAAPGVGPAFGDSGVVRTPVRTSSDDFATAMAIEPDGQVVVAAGAGGDFGLARLTANLHPGDLLGPVDGRVTTDFGGTDDVARAVAVTSGGLVVAAGSAGADLAVARYEHSGVLDRSFDGDGRLTVDLGGPDDSAFALAVLADGRLLVVGGRPSSVTVLRLLPDGRPDPTFGGTGRVTVPSTGPGRAAAVQPDGRLLVAGGGDRLVVHRFLADGGLDSTFGVGGVGTVPAGGPATANAMVLGPDGMVTVAGTRGGDVVVARLGPTGQPDVTFGTAGITISQVGGHAAGYALSRRDDGALLVVGDAADRGLVVRYLPNGMLDTSFGTGGHTITGPNPVDGGFLSRFRAVAPHSDDGWIVAGIDGTDAVVGRMYEPDGVPRRAPGVAAIDFGHLYQRVTSSAVQPDGKVVVVAEAGGDVALVRYNPDGTRDPAFGVAGVVVSDRASYPAGVVVQPSGRIVVAGTSDGTGLAIVGFRPDGSLDTAFGTDGRRVADITGETQLASSLAMLPDGRLLAGGASDAGSSFARYTEGGLLDPSFGQGGVVIGAFPGYPSARPRRTQLQGDGRILALGLDDRRLYRLNADGTADRSFGVDGRVQFELDDLRALERDGGAGRRPHPRRG